MKKQMKVTLGAVLCALLLLLTACATAENVPTPSTDDVKLVAGETVAVTISNAEGLTQTWSSVRESIATVSPEGVITAVSYGNTTVRCKLSDGTTINIKVTVIQLNYTEATVMIGETKSLSVKGISYDTPVTWTTGDANIVTVDGGSLKAAAPGSTTVTAAVEGFTPLSATITVSEPAFDVAELNLKPGGYELIELQNVGRWATIEWTSDDTNVATVSADSEHDTMVGVIARAPGATIIRAKLSDAFSLSLGVTVSSAGLELSSDKIKVGETAKMKITGVSFDTSYAEWSFSDPGIAKAGSYDYIDHYWKLIGLSPGTTTISAIYEGRVIATAKVKVDKISLKPKKFKLGVGKTRKLEIKGMAPGYGPVQEWTSSNKKVATVNSYGEVTGKGVGTATISVSLNGAKKISATVTVIPALEKETEEVAIGETVKLKVNGAGKTKVKWSSGNSSIATVSSDGEVKAGNKTGKVTITAKCGKTTMKCKVTVQPKLTITVRKITDTAIYNEVYLDFHNYSNKKVVYVKLDITQYDNAGHHLTSPYSYYYLNETIQPRSSLNNWEYWVHDDTKKVSVSITDVTYSDGTHWKP